MRRSCRLQPSHNERAIGVVRCKNEGLLLQPLWWRCVDCVIHHERDVREEQQYICEVRASNKSDFGAWTLLLLAATVWSFAHVPLGIFRSQQQQNHEATSLWQPDNMQTSKPSVASTSRPFLNSFHLCSQQEILIWMWCFQHRLVAVAEWFENGGDKNCFREICVFVLFS